MRIRIGNKVVLIKKGDITEEEVDAIVNAAGTFLRHGGGVARAIVMKGGKVIQEESNKIGYLPVGEAAVTSAGKLKAKWVIHTVGPRWGEGNEENKLRKAVYNALKKAKELKASKISMPAISTGIFSYPKKEATAIIFDEVVKFLKKESYPKEVRLISIDQLIFKLFSEHARKYSKES